MAWVVGLCNPASAALTGPITARLGGAPATVRRHARIGWAVLLVAQSTFLALGILTGLHGFLVGPTLMVTVAVVNLVASREGKLVSVRNQMRPPG